MTERTSDIFEVEFEVQPDDIDGMNHVNNLVYLKWSNKSAGLHTKSVGWGTERLKAGGAVFLVRSHDITYRKPALLGDKILVRTWISEFTGFSATRRFEIRLCEKNTLLANGNSVWVYVNLQENRLTRIPEAIVEALGCSTEC